MIYPAYQSSTTIFQSRGNKKIIFKEIVELSPLPVLIVNATTNEIEYANEAWELATGYKLDEVKGRNPDILKSDRTPKEIHDQIRKHLNEGKIYKTEQLFDKRKDGSEFQLSSTFYPIRQDDRNMFYVQIEHDITARKIKEKFKTMHINIALLLAASENIFDAVPRTLEYLCEGTGWEIGELWLLSHDNREMQYIGAWHSPNLNVKEYIDKTTIKTFIRGKGLPGRVWQTGKPAWYINSPNNLFFKNIEKSFSFGINTALAFPIQINLKTTGVLTFFTRETHKPDNDLLETMSILGNHLGHFIEHKRMEEKLANMTVKQRLLLNAIGQGVYGVDTKGKLTFINPAAEHMLGWSADELKGKRIHDIIHRTRSDAVTPLKYYQCPNVKIRKRIGDPIQIDKEIFWRKDGTFFPVEYIVTPIPENNKIIGSVVTFSDITKRKQLEELKKEFLATAAHELKTPITSLKLLSQLQLSKIKNKIPVKVEEMAKINNELERLTRIINDILDDQRIETGKLSIAKNKIDLSALVKDTAEQISSIFGKVKIICKVKPGILVSADSDRIRQVLTNLLTNAIKYSSDESEIVAEVTKTNNKALVSVSDKGIGISSEKQEKIFDRFFQIQEGKSGFGLGLYISKQIINLHKGRIWVKSKEGEGSTFHFTLALLQ